MQTLKQTQTQALKQTTSQVVERALQRKWDSKLTRTPENLFPLAPVDLVEIGVVNPGNYLAENELLSSSRYVRMSKEIRRWGKEPGSKYLAGSVFEIHGAGLFRGFYFIEELLRLGMEVRIRDASSVACKNAKAGLKRMQAKACCVIRSEILSSWKRGDIEDAVMGIYMPQVIQITPPEEKDEIMRHIGEWLRDSTPDPDFPTKRAYFVHARLEDNNTPREWGTISLPGVKWGDSIPYTDEELLIPAQAGHGDSAKLELSVIAQHSYYHQVYSLMKMSVAR